MQRLKGAMVLSWESTNARMERLAQLEFFLGKHLSLNRTLKEIEQVEKDMVISVAREYLSSSRFFLTVLGPEVSDEDWERDLI